MVGVVHIKLLNQTGLNWLITYEMIYKKISQLVRNLYIYNRGEKIDEKTKKN